MIMAHKYMRGRGVPRDFERALQLFDAAARAGSTDALYQLGKCYLKGTGCVKDTYGGVSCLERAAQMGHQGAALRLGACFEQGIGAPQSMELAEYWYRKASALGSTDAYERLLHLCRNA